MPTAEIVWVDPPPPPPVRRKVARLVGELKRNPGKWALVSTSLTNPSAAYKRARLYLGTEWQARKRDDGTFDIYGRWIGDGEQDAAGTDVLTAALQEATSCT